MGIELGRVSGPLLAKNLLRQGIDLAFETDLLYLDVNTGKIGINSDSPTRELLINSSVNITSLIVDTQADIADFTVLSNKIQNPTGAINVVPNQLLDPTVTAPAFSTDDLYITNRSISTLSDDTNIELTADGVGKVIFNTTKVNISGNLHATGNITWDGDITFGNNNLDSVTFNSDIASDLKPNVDKFYELGNSDNYWQHLYSTNLVNTTFASNSLTVDGIDTLLTQGNIIYVSQNGSDSNYGTHPRSTFRTIKHALSVATTGDTVFVYPGNYQEIFPLTVPAGVTVNGEGIRSVAITPTVGTRTKDAFLLNGDTTISNLTIKDFYYDPDLDTGYAFKFANGCQVVSRSPYIQNCTVITTDETGTIGFGAGRGALADGSVVSSLSKEASMLFHAVTLIVPNADAITAMNGVRVEWLNSFTYFAHRGIHLVEGTLGFASDGVKYGAEMRSINSANVYGTYGAVADGEHTLGYLIGHNFGYVGTGLNYTNDPSLVIQANEIVAINGGKLYYDSMDHKGDYRIGDIFYVNQQTGNVSFVAQSINFGASGSIVLEGVNGITIIDVTGVQTGNIKVHDNNIDSFSGPVNFYAIDSHTNLQNNTYVTGNLGVSGDVKVDGNVYLGNNPLDLVNVVPRLTQNINPRTTNTFTLGENLKRWRTAFLNELTVDATQVLNNTITTVTSNVDLKFVASGTGKVHVTSTDVQVDNNLTVVGTMTVNGLSTLQDVSAVGTINLTGNIGQTGNTYITGLFGNNNIIVTGAGSYVSVPNVKIQNNQISATATNDDLQFYGNGTGGVVLDGKLKITNNVISNVWPSATTNSQKGIYFTPTGTGNLVINSTKFLKLPVSNDSTKVLSASGEIRQNSTTGSYEGYLSTGPESFTNLYDVDRNTYITPELTIGANDNILRFGVNGTVRATIDSSKLTTPAMQVGNLIISTNYINNPFSNSDINLTPSGTGSINFNNMLVKDDTITNTLDSALVLKNTGTGYVKFNGTYGVVFPSGNTSERRDTPELGETRYNTQLEYMEVYNGTSWIPAVGTLGAAPLSEVLDIMDFWGLILG